MLLSHKATLGRTALVGSLSVPYLVLTPQVTYYRVRNERHLGHRYLKYYFDSDGFQELFVAWAQGGSTRAYLGITAQLKLPIGLPPIETQRAIARVLGALDNRIELNGRMNRTLEAMARALFKSWFVDFEPVQAKAASRQPFGMDAETAAMFPSRFVESEWGPIPEGWIVARLPDAFEVNPSRKLPSNQPARYLDMQAMPSDSAHPDFVERRLPGSGMRFTHGDTLVARITPCLENGKTAYVGFLEPNEVGWGSTEYIVLRPRAPMPPEIGYFLARSDGFRDFAISTMTGSSGRQRVPAPALAHYLVVLPPTDVASSFGTWARSALEGMKVHMDECRHLAALRDALLPKLLSGEIRVRDAAAEVDKAL